jgi:twinkle protein
MKKGLREGKVKGTTTYNEQIDMCWTWRKQEANIWTGYANEGKSLFLKQLCLIKALKEKWRFAFCAPEDFPAEEFYDDCIHTIAGISTDKDRLPFISEEQYDKAFALLKDLFVFVYLKPPHNTIKGALAEFEKLCEEEQIDGCIIDPLLKFARPKGFTDRDDIYASYVGSLCSDFCRHTNTSFHLVMHQLTPQQDPMTKKYKEPNMYSIKGGGSWADGFDNVLNVWRPNYAVDKLDATVQFGSQKIKKQKLVGIPQKMECGFDRKTNRYVEKNQGAITPDTMYGEPLFNFDSIMSGQKLRKIEL